MKNNAHDGSNARQQYQWQTQITQIVVTGEPKPESQLQKEFAERTGISCGKPAREWLEHLMDRHGFTRRELGASWRGGSIGWDYEANQPRISTPVVEAALTRFLIGWAGLYCLAMVAAFLLNALGSNGNKFAMLGVAGALGLFLAVFWMGQTYVLWPRMIALRARLVS